MPLFNQGAVSVFDLSTNLPVTTTRVGGGPVDAAVSPDGSSVFVTNFDSGPVSVISSPSDTVVATIPVGTFPFGVAVTPDGFIERAQRSHPHFTIPSEAASR